MPIVLDEHALDAHWLIAWNAEVLYDLVHMLQAGNLVTATGVG